MKKLAMLVGLAALMEKANDGTTGSASGGAVTEQSISETAPEGQRPDTAPSMPPREEALPQAPDVADTSGDTAGHPPGAHLDAPSAGNADATDEVVITRGVTVAIVAKGNERIPVQLRDKAHLDELRREHGEAAVEVQS